MKNESGMPETYVVVANSRVTIKVKQVPQDASYMRFDFLLL